MSENNGHGDLTRLLRMAALGDVHAQTLLLHEAIRRGDMKMLLGHFFNRGVDQLQTQLAQMPSGTVDYTKLLAEGTEAAFLECLVKFVKDRCVAPELPKKSIYQRLMKEAKLRFVHPGISEDTMSIDEEPLLEGLEVRQYSTGYAHEILIQMDQEGFRPANFGELLLWAIHRLNEYFQYQIIACGHRLEYQSWGECFPSLYNGEETSRGLNLCRTYWHMPDSSFRFLVRRK